MENWSFVDRITEKYLERGYFPSAVVSIFDRQGTLYRKAYGGNYLPDGRYEQTRTDTAYDMASCTKIATATQILLLVDEGKLSLKTPVGEVLAPVRSHPALYERVGNVTLFQLLTHTSGILPWYPFYVQKGRGFYDVFESFIGSTKVEKGVVYSDMNFMLLGKVVEALRQKDLKDCQEELRKRLGADRMDYCPEGEDNTAPSCYGNQIEKDMVRERGLSFDGWREDGKCVIGVNDGNSHYYFEDTAGHAGICADADAYERLARFYMQNGRPVFEEAMREQAPGRGLGFDRTPGLYGRDGCGHTGFTGTWFFLDSQRGYGAVALANRLAFKEKNEHNTNEFRRELASALAQYMDGR